MGLECISAFSLHLVRVSTQAMRRPSFVCPGQGESISLRGSGKSKHRDLVSQVKLTAAVYIATLRSDVFTSTDKPSSFLDATDISPFFDSYIQSGFRESSF